MAWAPFCFQSSTQQNGRCFGDASGILKMRLEGPLQGFSATAGYNGGEMAKQLEESTDDEATWQPVRVHSGRPLTLHI